MLTAADAKTEDAIVLSGLVPGQLATSSADERPHAGTHGRMHPLTLRFEGDLEHQFGDEYFTRTLQQVRLALVLAILLYAVFGVLDIWIAPNQRGQIWFIRYALIVPALIACLAFSYTAPFRRYREAVLGAVMLAASLGIVAMTAIIPAPGSYLYYAGLSLCVIYIFTLLRVSVPFAAAIVAVVIAAYVVVALEIIETPAELLVNNLFFLVSSAAIGLLANYSMERYARTNFLQRQLIELRTGELEMRNAELVERNRELALSRAATVRSAHRSELIFSALSEALPGTVLDDKYRVEEKIGAGNFGTVYRGQHILLHHAVAIKVFRPAVGQAGLDSLDRFRLEGISACRVNHPNAVTVLDFEVSVGSLAYLVMELLHGHSLGDELKGGSKIPGRRCAEIATAVCSVLSAAHEVGIVHRDIKPSNVFLHQMKGEELVKVIDFGIAKLTAEAQDPELQRATADGTLVGTLAYMAPERLSGDPYDGRADVYAVGVMLYEMLCGQLPFQARGAGYWSLARMHVMDRPTPPRELEPSVPAELEAAVLRALIKEPKDRPTAAELATELGRFLQT